MLYYRYNFKWKIVGQNIWLLFNNLPHYLGIVVHNHDLGHAIYICFSTMEVAVSTFHLEICRVYFYQETIEYVY
jgi:hypothetical protein